MSVTLQCTGTQLKITTTNQEVRDCLYEFIHKRLVTYAFKRSLRGPREIDAIYSLSNNQDILLHANLLESIEIHLSMYGIAFTVTYPEMYTPAPVDCALQDKYTLFEYQEKAVNFLRNHGASTSRLIGFTPGAGKTITFLAYVARVKHLCGAVMKPGYADQWYKVIPTVLDIKQEEILFINSTGALIKAQKKVIAGTFNYKFVLFSNTTVQRYVQNPKDDRYLMSIEDFMRRIRIGTLVIDEVHETLHLNYCMCISIAIPLVVGLSGTFITRDNKIKQLHDQLIPIQDRYDLLTYKPYIKYIEAQYSFAHAIRPVCAIRGSVAYSHVAYEEWLINHKGILRQFIVSLVEMVKRSYLSRRKPGEKLLIYAQRTSMILLIQEALEYVVDDSIKIGTYIGGDEYKELLINDIIVAGPAKAGAALDLPGLITVISTYLTLSLQRVIQMLGRLRDTKDRDMIYVQYMCNTMEKHVTYQATNRDVLADRTASYDIITLPTFTNQWIP